MSNATIRLATQKQVIPRVRPSRVDPTLAKPFTWDQELEPFARWAGDSVWVPPKDSSLPMAQSMLKNNGPFTSNDKMWSSVVAEHKSSFTHVREIELEKASIRLPQGKLFVTITEQGNFDKITDTIPACVQTRLDEFLSGPGKRPGVKVYYLKPLCIEVGDSLVFTSREGVMTAVKSIQDEVFAEYRRLYRSGIPRQVASAIFNFAMCLPRGIVNFYVNRKKRAIEAYEAKLEFKRRKTVLRAAKSHRKCFTTGCSFDEMLALTSPFPQAEVVKQYAIEHDLSVAERQRLIRIVAGTLPWFVTFSLAAAFIVSVSVASTAPVAVCDPVFVAEMPDAPGVLLKIGHFDEIGGVTHIEI